MMTYMVPTEKDRNENMRQKPKPKAIYLSFSDRDSLTLSDERWDGVETWKIIIIIIISEVSIFLIGYE